MKKRILVVDDEVDILEVVVFELKDRGYDTIEASDGAQALEMIRLEKPDLILLDLELPVLDGYGVCAKLSDDDELKKIPIILLTASTYGQFGDLIKNELADDCAIKPFDFNDLAEKIERLIG